VTSEGNPLKGVGDPTFPLSGGGFKGVGDPGWAQPEACRQSPRITPARMPIEAVSAADSRFLEGFRAPKGTFRGVKSQGFSLAETVITIALLGLILVAVAAMSVQTQRGGVANRRMFEANCLAQDLLERQMAQSVYDLALGAQAPLSGYLQDQTPYRAVVEVYSLGGSGPATGLSDQEVKRVRVAVSWQDRIGPHSAQAESVLARIPK